jgi:hypothetical protein
MVPPEVAVTPVAPATAPFWVRLPAAFSVTLPPLDDTLPFSVMLPALVRLDAVRMMLPVAAMPPAPTVNGLLAGEVQPPPLAVTGRRW